MRARIICLGHAVLDRIYRLERFPTRATKIRASHCLEIGGGMAANAAVAIARLGGQAALWSRVGDDSAGVEIVAGLAREGVECSSVRHFSGAVSSTSCILVDAAGERMIVNHRGEGLLDDPSWLPLGDIAGAAAVLADARWGAGALALFKAARRSGVPTVMDADVSSSELLPAILPLTDYCLFSGPGLAEWGGEDVEAALGKALAAGARHAGVTLGGAGYSWRGAGGAAGYQPGFSIRAVDTTGAGDAFHGAFAHAVGEGLQPPAAARLAAAVAALKCMHAGSRKGLPSRAEAEAFLAQHS